MPSVLPDIGKEITREPTGVVGLITPWNFPSAIPAWKIAPALAFGNCVVFKPAGLVAGSAWAMADIIRRSGVPAGVFSLVMGCGSVIGDRYIGVAEGATLAMGGESLKRSTEGHYLAPAFFVDTSASMRINREEIFGPVASVIRVKDYDEALEVVNDTPFGLSAGIATTSLKHATHFKWNAQAGMVMVNMPTAGVDSHVPSDGRKASSYGSREQGRYAQEYFTVLKTAYTFA